ncbi:pirin family protein [Sphaerisporangium sp. NPDC005289]|uniref:pirin family protein n=1 Tax=Sphaerisporangium sp. NPDC005289 TaxID=3155247 RepID=UPI0033AC836B
MSNLEREPHETACGGEGEAAEGPVRELLAGRDVVLGGTRGIKVTRTLPGRERRMVGAWCFLDHYGPERATMSVGPHPHTGLQTVTWLLEGEVLHRDSVGSEQLIGPGRLNIMTAGRAIAHSEESVRPDSVIHGVQLWVALPSASRHAEPSFEHHADLPRLVAPGVQVTVFAGELAGLVSPARVHSPLTGAEVAFDDRSAITLPLRPDFEYAVLALSGEVEADGTRLTPGPMLYLGSGRSEIALASAGQGRALLLGGEPFEEEILMWWNFVGRDQQEIERFRKEWEQGAAFGDVGGTALARIPAPPLPTIRLKPRGRRR